MELIKNTPGFLTVLTGKTGMGKSTITVFDCSEEIRQGKRVTFFSYEYCQSIIYNKMISHFNLKWTELFNLNIVDSAHLSLESVVEIIKAKKGEVDIVYIDYLDLLKSATFPHKEEPTAEENLKEIQKICQTLASLAEELNISIVLLSQMGSSADFEETIQTLHSFTNKVKTSHPVIKMFIGKGNVIDERIDYGDISHIILIDGYNLKHFSSINIKEVYKN